MVGPGLGTDNAGGSGVAAAADAGGVADAAAGVGFAGSWAVTVAREKSHTNVGRDRRFMSRDVAPSANGGKGFWDFGFERFHVGMVASLPQLAVRNNYSNRKPAGISHSAG